MESIDDGFNSGRSRIPMTVCQGMWDWGGVGLVGGVRVRWRQVSVHTDNTTENTVARNQKISIKRTVHNFYTLSFFFSKYSPTRSWAITL